MRREREIKLLRNRKRLNKRYSDFELGLLTSEIIDYTYLLKSIHFPIEKYKVPETKKEKEKGNLNEEKGSKKNKEINNNNNKIILLDEDSEEKESKKEDDDEEYNDLKVKEKKIVKKRKAKRIRNNQN